MRITKDLVNRFITAVSAEMMLDRKVLEAIYDKTVGKVQVREPCCHIKRTGERCRTVPRTESEYCSVHKKGKKARSPVTIVRPATPMIVEEIEDVVEVVNEVESKSSGANERKEEIVVSKAEERSMRKPTPAKVGKVPKAERKRMTGTVVEDMKHFHQQPGQTMEDVMRNPYLEECPCEQHRAIRDRYDETKRSGLSEKAHCDKKYELFSLILKESKGIESVGVPPKRDITVAQIARKTDAPSASRYSKTERKEAEDDPLLDDDDDPLVDDDDDPLVDDDDDPLLDDDDDPLVDEEDLV